MRRLATILALLCALAIGAEAGAIFVAPTPSVSGVIQNDSPKLAKWRSALAKLQSGTANTARILCLGDSNTTGQGAVGGAGSANKGKSYPRQLADFLTKAGIPAREASFMGLNVGTTAIPITTVSDYDPRLSIGSGWNYDTGAGLQLGGRFWLNTTTTNPLSFTPAESFDSIDVYYVENTGLATFTVNVDGGAAVATVSSAVGSATVKRVTATCTLGTHTVNVARNGTGAGLYILGVDTRDSTAGAISIINAGISGARASDVSVSGALHTLGEMAVVAPDLTLLSLSLNDPGNSPNPVTYKTYIQAIITQALATGSVVLSTSIPAEGFAPWVAGNGPLFNQIIRDLASENGLLLIDHEKRLGSYAAANGLGLQFDTLHPNKAGYRDWVRAWAAPLLNY